MIYGAINFFIVIIAGIVTIGVYAFAYQKGYAKAEEIANEWKEVAETNNQIALKYQEMYKKAQLLADKMVKDSYNKEEVDAYR